MLWNSIPSQLARENRKFMYGLIREEPARKNTKWPCYGLPTAGLSTRSTG